MLNILYTILFISVVGIVILSSILVIDFLQDDEDSEDDKVVNIGKSSSNFKDIIRESGRKRSELPPPPIPN